MSAPNPHSLLPDGVDRTDGEGAWRTARAVSMALGVLGLVVFWGTMAVMFVVVWRYLSASAPAPDAGGSPVTYLTVSRIVSALALTAHVLGLVVIMKAPRAKRKGGLVLNGPPLILLLSTKLVGLLWYLTH